jgi:hypothetical protein
MVSTMLFWHLETLMTLKCIFTASKSTLLAFKALEWPGLTLTASLGNVKV